MAPHSSSGVIQYLRSQKWFEKTFFYTVYEAENVTVASELKAHPVRSGCSILTQVEGVTLVLQNLVVKT